MSLAQSVLFKNDDLPVRVAQPVHSGKVRSVYWLTENDSRRLIRMRGYPLPDTTPLAAMVISDRISAFDCIWRAQEGLDGVPQKGAALNAMSKHWFDRIAASGIASHHVVDVPHPLVWIVQKARPVMIEAIVRQYITGSMWRSYAKGERTICGTRLPEGLKENQRLPEPLLTPSTKGVMRGLAGVAEQDDVNISRDDISRHLQAFRFRTVDDVTHYESLLNRGFKLISTELAKIDQIFVDTKFEFGYGVDEQGRDELIFIDEVGTPDSSRIWDGPAHRHGKILERSKEGFRQMLIQTVPDADVLLNKGRMPERVELARDTRLSVESMMEVSRVYVSIAEQVLGKKLTIVQHPRAEIIDTLGELDLIVRS